MKIEETNYSGIGKNNTKTQVSEGDSFKKLVKNDENYLDLLDEEDKEIHQKALSILSLELDDEKMAELNQLLLAVFKNDGDIDILDDQQKKLYDQYSYTIDDLQKQIEKSREERLQFKKLQVNTFITDELLKSKNAQDGLESKEHEINIEV